ncbi:hypothetical protein [Thermosynechococcus sp. FA-CM-4201]
MRLVSKIFLAFMTFILLIACSIKDSVVGKWEGVGVGSAETMELYKDGTLIINSGRLALTGRYTFLDEDRIKFEFSGLAALAGPQIFKISISNGELHLENHEGRKLRYQKAKN